MSKKDTTKQQEPSIDYTEYFGQNVKLDSEKDFKEFSSSISNKIKEAGKPSKMMVSYFKQCTDLFTPKLESENLDVIIKALTVISNLKKKEDTDKNKRESKKIDEFFDMW